MSVMQKDGMIYAAIIGVMNDVGAVAKNDVNSFDKYKFRGIDAVMNALHPAMVKNRVFVVPNVLEASHEERESKNGGTMIYTRVRVSYTFCADDGSSVEAVVVGEAMDRSDKSTNKAMSAAFKYACFQTFCIPTEEMQDADKDSPDPMPKKEETPVDSDGYPTRKKMLAVVMAKYPAGAEQTAKMLEYFKIDSVDKLTDTDLKVMYNKAMKK